MQETTRSNILISVLHYPYQKKRQRVKSIIYIVLDMPHQGRLIAVCLPPGKLGQPSFFVRESGEQPAQANRIPGIFTNIWFVIFTKKTISSGYLDAKASFHRVWSFYRSVYSQLMSSIVLMKKVEVENQIDVVSSLNTGHSFFFSFFDRNNSHDTV